MRVAAGSTEKYRWKEWGVQTLSFYVDMSFSPGRQTLCLFFSRDYRLTLSHPRFGPVDIRVTGETDLKLLSQHTVV